MNQKRTIMMIGFSLIALVAIAFFIRGNGDVKHFSSTKELSSFLDASTDNSYSNFNGGTELRTAGAPQAAKADSGKSSDSAGAMDGASGYSGTNVQVAGVDEPDFVKTDGNYIYVASGENLSLIKAGDGRTTELVHVLNVGGSISNLFVNGDKLIVFGQGSYYYGPCVDCEKPMAGEAIAAPDEKVAIRPYSSPKSFVKVYDISDKNAPKVVQDLEYDGSFYDARMIGSKVYTIVYQPIVKNGDNIIMPEFAYNGAGEKIAASDVAYFPVPDYGYQFTTVFTFDLTSDSEPTRASFLTGYTQNMYVSENNIYLTAPKYVSYTDYQEKRIENVVLPLLSGEVKDSVQKVLSTNKDAYEKEQEVGALLGDYYNALSEDDKTNFQEEISKSASEFEMNWQKDTQKTVIHKISFDGDSVKYVGKGEVSGYVLNQFSMDEKNGYLRIATTINNFGGWAQPFAIGASDVKENVASGKMAPNAQIVRPSTYQINEVYVLDGDLKIVGSLENIAPNENIKSARFIGDRLYLVTFREIDPLFVIDLSEPTNPNVLGELKIPGFSSYLHPFDETHVIGIGQDTDGEVEEGQGILAAIPAGLKLALFDVSDPSNPKEVDRYIIGDRGSSSDVLYDHKAFLFNPETGLLVIPVTVQQKIKQTDSRGIPQDSIWYPTKTVFEGAYMFNLDKERGFTLRNTITHLSSDEQDKMRNSNESDYWYPPYEAHIKRSLYIRDVLYTVSSRSLKATSLSDYGVLATINLPAENYYPYRFAADSGATVDKGIK